MTPTARPWIYSPNEPPALAAALASCEAHDVDATMRRFDLRTILWCMALQRSRAAGDRILDVHVALLDEAVRAVEGVTAGLPGHEVRRVYDAIVAAWRGGGALPAAELRTLMDRASHVDVMPPAGAGGGMPETFRIDPSLTGALGPVALVAALFQFSSLVAWSRTAPARFDIDDEVGFALRSSSHFLVDAVRVATELTRATWNADRAALVVLDVWGSAPLLPEVAA